MLSSYNPCERLLLTRYSDPDIPLGWFNQLKASLSFKVDGRKRAYMEPAVEQRSKFTDIYVN